MKIKQDFVTNSSSTSFLISIPQKIEENNENSVLFDLAEQILDFSIISNMDDLRKFIGSEDQDNLAEEIEKGNTLVYFSIPYGGEVGIDSFLRKYNAELIYED